MSSNMTARVREWLHKKYPNSDAAQHRRNVLSDLTTFATELEKELAAQSAAPVEEVARESAEEKR